MAVLPVSVTCSEAPTAIGPDSQAIRHGGMLWCSGQLGIDPASGRLVSDTDTVAQAERALLNLDAICREAGTSLQRALRLTVYLVDLQEFAAVNAAYARWFEPPFPARATVQVAALPLGGRVEIDAIVAL